MQVETERYITKIRDSVEEIRNKEQLPKWQIDFDKYGGRLAYEIIKNLYWERYERRNSNNFDLQNEFLTPDVYRLMRQFRKDINVQLDIPKKYDIYR